MKSILLKFLLLPFIALLSVPKIRAEESIKIAPLQAYTSLKDIYKSDGTPQVLMVMHFPKGAGTTFIELHNLTKRNISIFQFSVHSVGQVGDLSFEDLPAGWSGVKETNMTNIRELTIIQPRAIDDHAVEFFPKLVVHYEIGLTKKMIPSSKKKIGK
jgi:hypothetical protein